MPIVVTHTLQKVEETSTEGFITHKERYSIGFPMEYRSPYLVLQRDRILGTALFRRDQADHGTSYRTVVRDCGYSPTWNHPYHSVGAKHPRESRPSGEFHRYGTDEQTPCKVLRFLVPWQSQGLSQGRNHSCESSSQ